MNTRMGGGRVSATARVSLLCVGIVGCLPAGPAGLNHASALYQSGKYIEAASEYRRVIALDPKWSAPYLGLGNALWKMGEEIEAIDAYKTAVLLSPDWSAAHIALGDALVDLKRWNHAVPVLERAIILVPGDPLPQALLGVALTELERNEEAVAAFESALKLCATCLDPHAVDAYGKARARLPRR